MRDLVFQKAIWTMNLQMFKQTLYGQWFGKCSRKPCEAGKLNMGSLFCFQTRKSWNDFHNLSILLPGVRADVFHSVVLNFKGLLLLNLATIRIRKSSFESISHSCTMTFLTVLAVREERSLIVLPARPSFSASSINEGVGSSLWSRIKYHSGRPQWWKIKLLNGLRKEHYTGGD